MTVQHAQAVIADLYDYEQEYWSTPESSYARSYLEFRLGKRKTLPEPPTNERKAKHIRNKIDEALKKK